MWTTSSRRPWLEPRVEVPLLASMIATVREVRCAVLAMGAADDHTHVLVRLAPSTPLSEVVRRMKGASSYELKRRDVLPETFSWQTGYWAETVNPRQADKVTRYVHNQRQHHTNHPDIESWATT